MDRKYSYPFEVELAEAKKIQDELRNHVSGRFPYRKEAIRLVAGIDVSYPGQTYASASVVVLAYPSLAIEQVVTSRVKVSFPYIPGFLSFREGPAIEEALRQLTRLPQIFFFDGQGLSHPRRFGLASHLGVLYDVVSIGVAKKCLIGKYRNPRPERGSYAWIVDRGERIGTVVRTRSNVQPVFVSPGHRIGLKQAMDWTMAVTGSFRLPEPTRQAHLAGSTQTKPFAEMKN